MSPGTEDSAVRMLNTGDAFPGLKLNLTDGTGIVLPECIDSRYMIVLFYRGHW